MTPKAEAYFKIAPASVAQTTLEQLTALNQVKFSDDEERRLACASLLMDHQLYSNAVKELEVLAENEVSPMVHAVLAEAWRISQRPFRAATRTRRRSASRN